MELGHGRIKPDGDLSAGGLYRYEAPADEVGRQWRPDLIPAILRWIDQVPPCDLRMLVAFGISGHGGFIAYFLVPTRTGETSEVSIRFDHKYYLTSNEHTGFRAPKILDYHLSHLFGTANLP